MNQASEPKIKYEANYRETAIPNSTKTNRRYLYQYHIKDGSKHLNTMVLVMTMLISIFGRDGGKLDKTNFDFGIFRHANDTHLTLAPFLGYPKWPIRGLKLTP